MVVVLIFPEIAKQNNDVEPLRPKVCTSEFLRSQVYQIERLGCLPK